MGTCTRVGTRRDRHVHACGHTERRTRARAWAHTQLHTQRLSTTAPYLFLSASQERAPDPHSANPPDGAPLPEQPPVPPTVPLPELQHLRGQGQQQLLRLGKPRRPRQHGQAQLQGHGGGLSAER